jgi:DNA-binding MarR family transcriptional regulator
LSTTRNSRKRVNLLSAAINAIYGGSSAAVFFHDAVAEQIGLSAIEEKTLLMLSGGHLTAGEIATNTGLTTPSVTSLIDRLELKGFVRRVRDTADRRRVYVEADPKKLGELMQVFGSMQGQFDDLLAPYTDDQLTTITDYLTRAAQRSQKAIVALRHRKGNASNETDE